MKKLLFSCLILFSFSSPLWALGPHEIILIANSRSDDSMHVANTYQHLRGVPEQNVIEVAVSMPSNGAPSIITHDVFTRDIWDPVTKEIEKRGLTGQILAWVYSCDLPTTIATDPQMSLMGITFLRNTVPESKVLRRGSYVSPLFAGPGRKKADVFGSQTFDLYKEWLGERMPIPSMMLGVTGKKGNTVKEILKCMNRGITSDYTAPSGNLYFVFIDDVRSRCREWQFERTAAELTAHGLRFVRLDREPGAAENVMGMFMGSRTVDPGRHQFLPGGIAEHLTSYAGAFHRPTQTKLTEWIRAGATASAGTVTEPLAFWAKFPHARLYAHYAAGCTVMESFYQSIKCPLQILIVGEPLASPWAERAELTINGVGVGDVSGYLNLSAETSERTRYGKFTYILDGNVIHQGNRLALDTRTLANGLHTLRVVAYRIGLVRNQVHQERSFRVRNLDDKSSSD
jgi:uncharacterized protein (TIGR03790 family)